tara:strand:- start:5641 stop:6381 length:741 start_codon:yes stop_codon:yes gene_type:complete
MPYGRKYEEPDELDLIQKAELLILLNPSSLEKRVAVYSKTIRLLQYFGYYRSKLTGVHMIKDNEPNVIFFKKHKFSVGGLSDIPNYIQFALYVCLTKNMSPDVPASFYFRKEIADILNQRSVKVARRIRKKLIQFLGWIEYKHDSGNLIHPNYPHIRNGEIDLNILPTHILMALWGYFVLPKLAGMQRRIGMINMRKKTAAYKRRLDKYVQEMERQREQQQQHLETIREQQRKDDEFMKELDKSGF